MIRRPLDPDRIETVFDRLFDEHARQIAPEERDEAARFWAFLGECDRPAEVGEPARRVGGRLAFGLIAALSAAFLIGLCAILAPPAPPEGQRFAAQAAQRRVLHMQDGSTITLAAQTEVEVSYGDRERRIRLLHGEAMFDVAHDRDRPFTVAAAGGKVVAIGTVFDVKAPISGTVAEVTVVEGIVRVAMSGTLGTENATREIERLAHEGDRIAFGWRTDHNAISAFVEPPRKVDPGLSTAWTRGMLYFHGEPLWQVVNEVNRYTSRKIVLTNKARANTPVYGLVAEGDTTVLADLLEHPDDISVER